METYESNVISIEESAEKVFQMLSNLKNLEKFSDKIPEEKIKNFSFDEDSIHIQTEQIGNLSVRIVEREPNKTIKFTSEESMLNFNLWLQLKEISEKETKAKITLKADIPFMFAPMVEGPIRETLNKMADLLTTLPYSQV